MNTITKVRRKAIKYSNRMFRLDREKLLKVSEMLSSPPTEKAKIDTWVHQSADLVRDTVLDRITKEDLALIVTGLVSYRKTGITPQATQAALIRAFENSSGLFQDVLHDALFEKLKAEPPTHSGNFGALDKKQIEDALRELRHDGYTVLPFKLPRATVETLQAEVLKLDYVLKDGGQSGQRISGIELNSPPDCILAYSVSSPTPTMEAVLADELLGYLASAHLGTKAHVIDNKLWFTFPNCTPSSESAQLFHYDLDTIRWVKVFIYLSDVTDESGPHEYVPGTHLPTNKAPEIMLKEYARITDQEIDEHYPKGRRRISGPAGTVMIGDTRCFHKGNAVKQGHRLIFSPIYAPSTIGYFQG